jgi:hypothetical protein
LRYIKEPALWNRSSERILSSRLQRIEFYCTRTICFRSGFCQTSQKLLIRLLERVAIIASKYNQAIGGLQQMPTGTAINISTSASKKL